MFQKLDNQGRVVIPAGFRKRLQIKEGDPLKVSLEENKIIVEPETDTEKCILCRTTEIELEEVEIDKTRKVKICTECLAAIDARDF